MMSALTRFSGMARWAGWPRRTVRLRLTGGITVLWGSASDTRQKAGELAALLRTHVRYFDVSDPNTVVTKR